MTRTTNWGTFALGPGGPKRAPIRPPLGLKGHGSRVACLGRLNARLHCQAIDKANSQAGKSTSRPQGPLAGPKPCKCAVLGTCAKCSIPTLAPRTMAEAEVLAVPISPKAMLRSTLDDPSNPQHTGHRQWLAEQLDANNVIVPTGYKYKCHWCMYSDCQCSWLDRMVRAMQAANLVAKGPWQEVKL